MKKHCTLRKYFMPILLAILAFAAVLVYRYFAGVKNKESVYKSLGYSAQAQATTINALFDGQFTALHTFANGLIRINSDNMDEVLDRLTTVWNDDKTTYAAIVLSDGTAYCTDNTTFDISDRHFFLRSMDGEDVIAYVNDDRRLFEPRVVLSTPIRTSNGIAGIIYVSVGETFFEERFAYDDYDGRGCAFVCDGAGEVVISLGDNAPARGTNILELFSRCEIHNNTSVEELQSSMRNGLSGVTAHCIEDAEIYAAYVPLGISDWSIFYMVPGEFVDEQLSKGLVGSDVAVAIVIVCAVVMLAFIIKTDAARVKELERGKLMAETGAQRFRAFVEQSVDVTFQYNFDDETICLYGELQSELCGALSGFTDNVPKTKFLTRVHIDDVETMITFFRDAVFADSAINCQVRLFGNEGECVWCEIKITPVYVGSDTASFGVGRITDISAEKNEVERLKKDAQTDLLTGLYNHDTTFALATDYLKGSGKKEHSALVMIDLDNFKAVNDSFGHVEGDETLKHIASYIRGLFRADDIVGRVGGDEFMVLMKNIATTDFVKKKAAELCETLHNINLGEACFEVTCSVGAALYMADDRSFNELYKEADAAMYIAKRGGKNRFALIDDELSDESRREDDEREARMNAAQLSTLMEYIDGGVIIVEVTRDSLKTIYASPSIFRSSVFTPECITDFLCGKINFIASDDIDRVESEVRKHAIKGEPLDITFRVNEELKGGWRHARAVRMPYENSKNPVLLIMISDVTAFKEQEHALFEDRQQLSLALEQTEVRMWTFDMQTETLEVAKIGTTYYDLPESAIKHNIVCDESENEFCRFIKEMKDGKEAGSCVVKLKMYSAYFRWYKLSFRMIFGDYGEPISATGITVPLHNIEAEKVMFEQEERIQEQTSEWIIATAKINVSAGSVCGYWTTTEKEDSARYLSTFDSLLCETAKYCATEEDRIILLNRLNIEQFLIAFERGNTISQFDYRVTYGEGRMKRVSVVTSLVKEPVSGDLYAFIYIKDVDWRKRWELASKHRILCDNITLLYTRETAEAIIRTIMKNNADSNGEVALGIVDFPEMDRLEDEYGAGVVRNMLIMFGRLFGALTPPEMIVGRMGRNKFVFFYAGEDVSGSIENVANTLNDKISDIRSLSSFSMSSECYVGICSAKMNETTFGSLVECAAIACDVGRGDGRRITMYSPSLSDKQPEAAMEEIAEREEKVKSSVKYEGEKADALIHDPLTWLLNRQSYYKRAMSSAGETFISLGAVFVDINGLGKLNHKYGTDYGDALIVFAANMLRSEFHDCESYRISGDELVCLASDLTHDEFIRRVNSLVEALDFTYEGLYCVGSAWSDRDIDIERIVDNAESIMMLGKQDYYFEGDLSDKRQREETLKKLQQCILDDSFKVYLQPKADAATREVVGAEALVRLVDPERGIISPAKFIPLYERERVIRFLDFHILEKTLKIMQRWRDSGKKLIPVSVNFSRSTLLSQNALDMTVNICNKYTVPSKFIEIEVTESVGVSERSTIIDACERFRNAGFMLSLDDFGSKYSSLYIMSAVKFDAVKIDKSLIDDVVSNKLSRILIENTIRVCAATGAKCVAEGVETEEQLKIVHELGCDLIQGYLFDRPLPSDDFEAIYIKN